MISNFFKKGRNRNLFVFVCVLALTVLTVGVTYASFFTVKTNTNNQVITTGTLEVSFANNSSSITKSTLERMSNQAGMEQLESSVAYIQNTGSLDSVFILDVGYDVDEFTSRAGYSASDKLVPIDYVMFAVYEYDGESDSLIVGPVAMSELPIVNYDSTNRLNNRYSLIVGTVGSVSSGNAAKTYKIKTWLSDKAVPAASYSYFYVNLNIQAMVEHSKMAYDLSGTISNGGNSLSGATISFHNGSKIVTSNSSGAWSLNDIYPGVYNIDIEYNDVTYQGNLTVVEESNRSTATLVSRGSTGTGTDLWAIANNYGTTVAKIIEKNELSGYSETITPSGTLNLYPTYTLTAGGNETISSISISLDETNETFTMAFVQ